MRALFLAVCALSLLSFPLAGFAEKPKSLPLHPSFSNDVMVVLQKHCTKCHLGDGEGVVKSGFSMESYESVLKGTKYGSVIVKGDATMSNIMRMIEGLVDPSIIMPHGQKKIPKHDRNIIRRWINDGAPNN